jgi:hypothetical protein
VVRAAPAGVVAVQRNRRAVSGARVPVHDLQIHPRDRELIVGTHGHGILIADISAYEDLTPAVLGSDASLARDRAGRPVGARRSRRGGLK